MIVVSDTTPIISLLKISRLDLLEKLFGEVLIPNAVYEELTADTRFIEEAKVVKNAPYIKSVPVLNPEAVRILRMDLTRARVKRLCLLMNEKLTFCLWMKQREGQFRERWELALWEQSVF